MSQSLASKIPKLRRGFRLQFEPVQNCHVLLYPEGMIKLNDSAGEILQQVNGTHSIDQIIDTLRERFPDVPGLDEDILAFMEVANAQFWIELH